MIIRKAIYEDLKDLVIIYNQAIAIGQQTADTEQLTLKDREGWFESHKDIKYPLYVIEDNNTVAGYLTITPYRPGRFALRYTAEVSYYIHNDYQRKGLGSKLLKHAIAMCPRLEIKTLFAILMETNNGSIKLLEKHGFKQWGHLPKIADFEGIEIGQFYYGLRIPANLN